LGVVLYTSVMARLPFEDESTNALYNKIKAGLYVIDKKISPELKDLLARLINTNPSKRIRLRDIIDHPWYLKFSPSKSISGIEIGYQTIPVDKRVVN
jgi:serine/threonine protein kinase